MSVAAAAAGAPASTSLPIVCTSMPAYTSPLPTGRQYTILKRHISEYAAFVEAIPVNGKYLPMPVAKIIAGYVADGVVFDREMWREYFEVDIGEETQAVRDYFKFDDFYKFFHGPNPADLLNGISVEKARRVCESCLMPVIRPETVTLPDGKSVDYCLNVLGQLTLKPRIGYPAGYSGDTPALQQNGMKKAGPMRVIIMLEDLVARGRPWSCGSPEPLKQGQVQCLKLLNAKTGFGCIEEPRGIDQDTAVMVHYVVSRERFLSDGTGKDGRYSGGRTCDDVQVGKNLYKMISCGFSETGPVGGPAPAVLYVRGSFYDDGFYGVAVLR